MQKKQLIIALLAFSLLTIVYDFSISQKTGVSLLNHALAEEMDQTSTSLVASYCMKLIVMFAIILAYITEIRVRQTL